MEADSAVIIQDLKDVATNLVVVDLFKYSLVSTCFHIQSRKNLHYSISDKKVHLTPLQRNESVQFVRMEESTKHIWATSWETLFMPYANNKGTDQPAHLRSLISAFVVCCLDSIIPLVSICELSSLYLVSVAAQAGLSLLWSQTPKTGFLMTRLIWVTLIKQEFTVKVTYPTCGPPFIKSYTCRGFNKYWNFRIILKQK